LIHVGKGDLAQRTAEFATDLSVYVVGGDHHRMLEPPEVTKVATAIAETIDTARAALPNR
jgi:thioesterase domain-containing protein